MKKNDFLIILSIITGMTVFSTLSVSLMGLTASDTVLALYLSYITIVCLHGLTKTEMNIFSPQIESDSKIRATAKS